VWANGSISRWLTFSGGLPDPASPHYVYASIEALVPAGGTVVVAIDMESRAVDRPSFFIDALTLEYVDTPIVCRGLPRIDYARRYHVLPQNATPERCAEVRKEFPFDTIGRSYDDGGIGDLSDKTAVLWDIPENEREAYRQFFGKWYPRTVVEFMPADAPPDPDPGELL